MRNSCVNPLPSKRFSVRFRVKFVLVLYWKQYQNDLLYVLASLRSASLGIMRPMPAFGWLGPSGLVSVLYSLPRPYGPCKGFSSDSACRSRVGPTVLCMGRWLKRQCNCHWVALYPNAFCISLHAIPSDLHGKTHTYIRAIARVDRKKVKLIFGHFSLDFSKKVKFEFHEKVKFF